MVKQNSTPSGSKFEEFKLSIINTDIRMLTVLPAVIGFGGFFVWILLMEQLTHGSTSQTAFEIGLGVASLIASLAGVAQLYKKQCLVGLTESLEVRLQLDLA